MKVLKWIYDTLSLVLYLPTKIDHPLLLVGTALFLIGLVVLWLKG
jgi:hypothetical protein